MLTPTHGTSLPSPLPPEEEATPGAACGYPTSSRIGSQPGSTRPHRHRAPAFVFTKPGGDYDD